MQVPVTVRKKRLFAGMIGREESEARPQGQRKDEWDHGWQVGRQNRCRMKPNEPRRQCERRAYGLEYRDEREGRRRATLRGGHDRDRPISHAWPNVVHAIAKMALCWPLLRGVRRVRASPSLLR
jgi:hypothetical protein